MSAEMSTPSCEILPLRFEAVGYQVKGQALVADLSFEITAGRPTVIMGPNGSGKSLTMRLAHGLLAPTSGRVQWLGPSAAEAARHQAMVFEKAVLLRRSVAANVDYALALRGLAKDVRAERVAWMLERTGLTPLASRAARVLSSGEQQRLSLARAWSLSPEVLFLDEPTAALDPAATRQVETLIQDLAAEGCKIVMISHDLGQARRVAGHVLFLHRGRLVESTRAEAFFDEPTTAEARAFLAGELIW